MVRFCTLFALSNQPRQDCKRRRRRVRNFQSTFNRKVFDLLLILLIIISSFIRRYVSGESSTGLQISFTYFYGNCRCYKFLYYSWLHLMRCPRYSYFFSLLTHNYNEMLIGLIQRETDNISFQQDAELPAFATATYSIKYCKCNNDGLSFFLPLS